MKRGIGLYSTIGYGKNHEQPKECNKCIILINARQKCIPLGHRLYTHLIRPLLALCIRGLARETIQVLYMLKFLPGENFRPPFHNFFHKFFGTVKILTH